MHRINILDLPDKIAARFAAYSVAGVANTIVGVSAILVAGALGTSAILANVIGYGLGLIVSFTLNSRITFRGRKVDLKTVLRFLVGFGIAFAVNIGIVTAATDWRHLPKSIASLTGTPVYVVLFFLLCEYWVFRHPVAQRHPTTNTSASNRPH
ncbi:MAG: GtrA family protein [Rhodanobacteraceae bacterium]|nr:MAG: GtrA family protein [Rhodanobacteraceae bacterium]